MRGAILLLAVGIFALADILLGYYFLRRRNRAGSATSRAPLMAGHPRHIEARRTVVDLGPPEDPIVEIRSLEGGETPATEEWTEIHAPAGLREALRALLKGAATLGLRDASAPHAFLLTFVPGLAARITSGEVQLRPLGPAAWRVVAGLEARQQLAGVVHLLDAADAEIEAIGETLRPREEEAIRTATRYIRVTAESLHSYRLGPAQAIEALEQVDRIAREALEIQAMVSRRMEAVRHETETAPPLDPAGSDGVAELEALIDRYARWNRAALLALRTAAAAAALGCAIPGTEEESLQRLRGIREAGAAELLQRDEMERVVRARTQARGAPPATPDARQWRRSLQRRLRETIAPLGSAAREVEHVLAVQHRRTAARLHASPEPLRVRVRTDAVGAIRHVAVARVQRPAGNQK